MNVSSEGCIKGKRLQLNPGARYAAVVYGPRWVRQRLGQEDNGSGIGSRSFDGQLAILAFAVGAS